VDGHVRLGISVQLRDIDRGFAMIAGVPELKDKPIGIGESDPDTCAACQGPQLGYCNTTMYSSYTAALNWTFEFEDQPFFAGQRTLANNGIDLPVLNVFRMFSKMNVRRIESISSEAVALDDIVQKGVRSKPDVARWRVSTGRRSPYSPGTTATMILPVPPRRSR
jgi:xylan 1,4-beta-xylosidase